MWCWVIFFLLWLLAVRLCFWKYLSNLYFLCYYPWYVHFCWLFSSTRNIDTFWSRGWLFCSTRNIDTSWSHGWLFSSTCNINRSWSHANNRMMVWRFFNVLWRIILIRYPNKLHLALACIITKYSKYSELEWII